MSKNIEELKKKLDADENLKRCSIVDGNITTTLYRDGRFECKSNIPIRNAPRSTKEPNKEPTQINSIEDLNDLPIVESETKKSLAYKSRDELEYNSESIGCGLEDLGIEDRYESAEYGFNEAAQQANEIINELEAQIKELQEEYLKDDAHRELLAKVNTEQAIEIKELKSKLSVYENAFEMKEVAKCCIVDGVSLVSDNLRYCAKKLKLGKEYRVIVIEEK